VPSDDPDEIDNLLQLRSDQARNTQIQSNLSLAQTDAQTADNALTSSIQLMDQALTFAAQGANATITGPAEQSLAQQIQGIQQQMVANSNTSVLGRFIFSGDNDSAAAYTFDATAQATNGVVQVSTATSTRQIENPSGGSFAASLTAQQIFDDRNPDNSYANDNVFQALNNLYNALVSGNSDAVGATISNLQAASTHLNSMQAFYGEVEDRVQAGQTFANSYATQLQTEIGNAQDADIPTAIMEMTQANTTEEAALQMEAKLPQTSLFNYLG
jgi:flagellar hook-associated protein 3 FlgL